MVRIIRTTAVDKDFTALVSLLDKELAVINGEQDKFFRQFNTLDTITHALLAYDDKAAVACGAIKAFDPEAMEIKRMYTIPSLRGKRIAAMLVSELETWASELGYTKCVLETSKQLPSAIQLYSRSGYREINRYGQYVDSENSVCFEKILRPKF